MSFHLLLKHYHNGQLEKFRALLSNGNNGQHPSKGYAGGQGNAYSMGSLVGSPSGFGTSPRMVTKARKVSGQAGNNGGSRGLNSGLTRAEVNGRDHAGLTLLHRAVSSTSDNSIGFAMALIEHPSIDLYVQDTENGWTALHRALYFGNITLARAIIERDSRDPTSQVGTSSQRAASSVIKVKDFEGNSPFDVYNATIARRTLRLGSDDESSEEDSQDESDVPADNLLGSGPVSFCHSLEGDEVFAWGSSRNHGLGFKDQDDRQHPEKINLKRPDHLLFRFYREHLETIQGSPSDNHPPIPKSVHDLPTLISNRKIIIHDVCLSKLHSAILTTDPESNLYMCGFGPGGRLGTGDETTRFSYVPIEEGALAGKKVIKVALGQNHTLAVTSDGSLSSWGTNTFGQLGYNLPRPALKDEEPVCATPRQIFGTLKREIILGVAASSIHSVAHTLTSLFTWGKNEGQLGLMDSDSRSLEMQTVPRKVAASLFKAHIDAVSAINAATIVLLSNHNVYVFTNYGYALVQFPLNGSFMNLKTDALTTRYESISNHICDITAGGDTIGAKSSRGDLFTLTVRKIDTVPTTSTTNPSKIRDSLSAPQRVWSLRKGHWDGIKSAGITENGSVIVCTHAGAVWRRVERSSIKNSSWGAGKRKDFKFQRVPGLSKVSAVRSTAFGVFAAIRKDCDVTRTQIVVDSQSLWTDIASLLSLNDLEISTALDDEDAEPRFWKPMLPTDLFGPLKRAILTSADLEADVARHLLRQTSIDYNIEVGTSTSEVRIPVHSFILARSPILRTAIHDFHLHGNASIPDLLVMEPGSINYSESVFGGGESTITPPRLILHGLDFIALVNLVIYLYTDEVIDVWHFTRQSPRMAFRYRQIRVEMMKVASHLKMSKLESAVRLMVEPERQLDHDVGLAMQSTTFFEDGNTIIELEDTERQVHSMLLCQRCPFFEGLFNGRAGGQWLASRRRDTSEAIRIDLKHIKSTVFDLVLRYIYADVGTELFDKVRSADIDEFSELVLDVMAVANELMLDRLSQICQQVIGRFVTTRNVSGLLNTIAPCSVTKFKDSALEYCCLQLESMLENHLLNDLDEDLLLDLDEVVRANQLNCLPFAKSGRAELLLLERHPSLADDIHEERQRRLRDIAFKANLKDDDNRQSNSIRVRVGSVDDLVSVSPGQDKSRRKLKMARNAPFSPTLRPKDSTADLMFDMDEDEQAAGNPVASSLKRMLDMAHTKSRESPSPNTLWDEDEPSSIPNAEGSSFQPITPGSTNRHINETPPSTKTWSSPGLGSSKLDMREIMAQASATRTSALSMSLSAQIAKDEAVKRQAAPKLSQKERKKQQQQQQILLHALSQSHGSLEKADSKPSSPWQIASAGRKTSLKDVFDQSAPSSNQPSNSLAPPVSPKPSTPRRAASPDTRFAGQSRNISTGAKGQSPSTPRPAGPQPRLSASSPIVPHSKSYTTPRSKAEPSLQLSMSDIIGQQRREQEVIKEAVAKRSLQEIQEEEAFNLWWDKESKKVKEEEAAMARALEMKTGSGSGTKKGARNGGSGGNREKGSGRGRGSVGRGRSDASRGRGRGRGGSGSG